MLFYVFLLYFFFFQAEDGIRDYKVTGVQTCALPICQPLAQLACRRWDMWRYAELLPVKVPGNVVSLGEGLTPLVQPRQEVLKTLGFRSEERRVGKECRSRWAA